MTGPSSATAARRSTRCGCGRAATPTFRLRRIQQRRFLRRRGRQGARRDDHARAVSRTITPRGRSLRFLQEYFLVALLARRHRRPLPPPRQRLVALPDKVAIQLNDTHPAMAVPELMRILLDEAKLGWDDAWDLTRRTLAYTNHTLLPEALEKWPVELFEALLPRHLEIIYEINRRFLDDVAAKLSGRRGRIARVSLIEEGAAAAGAHGQPRHRRLAQHQWRRRDPLRIAQQESVPDFAEMFPERFNNKTNGVTPRRWLLLANPDLAKLITEAIGDGWVTDLERVRETRPARRRRRVPRAVPRRASARPRCDSSTGSRRQPASVVDPDTIFDVPDQTHPRIQAATPQRAARRRALQPPARRTRSWTCRRARSSSRARPRRPTSSPSSSSSSSTTSPP